MNNKKLRSLLSLGLGAWMITACGTERSADRLATPAIPTRSETQANAPAVQDPIAKDDARKAPVRVPASEDNGKAYFQRLTDEVVGHYGDAFGWTQSQKSKISAALMYLYGRECGYDRMNYTPRDSDGLPKWGPAQFGKNFSGHYDFLAGVLGYSPELNREMKGVPLPNDIHDVRTVTACVLDSMLAGHDLWGSGNGKRLMSVLKSVHNPMPAIRARIRAARRK